MLVESSSQNPPEITTITTSNTSASTLPLSVNINELFQKLVATGIVTTVQENQSSLITQQPQPIHPVPSINRPPPPLPKKDLLTNIKPVNFSKSETLKM